jgi:large subunit ribosomal protein L5
MFFFKTYFSKVIKYDLINTFFYRNLIEIPKLRKITLNFGYQKSNFKYLVSSLLALEFISSKKGRMTKSKHLNVFLKIKKGNPVGCKIVLKKSTMYFFYLKLITSIFSKVKQSKTSRFQWDLKLIKSISFQLKSPLLFAELENQFQFFKDIPRLDITLLTNSKSQKELFFLLKSIKFFI